MQRNSALEGRSVFYPQLFIVVSTGKTLRGKHVHQTHYNKHRHRTNQEAKITPLAHSMRGQESLGHPPLSLHASPLVLKYSQESPSSKPQTQRAARQAGAVYPPHNTPESLSNFHLPELTPSAVFHLVSTPRYRRPAGHIRTEKA